MPRKTAERKTPKTKRKARRKPAPEMVTPARFAEVVGVSRAAVQKAISEGRLIDSVQEERKGSRTFRRIELRAGREEWASMTAPRLETGEPTLSMEPQDLDAGAPRPEIRGEQRELKFSNERARKEAALADKNELLVAQMQGQLMDSAAVVKAVEGLTRAIREKLAGWAAELADDLHMLPSKEVSVVLEQAAAEVSEQMASALDALYEKERR